MRDYFKQIRDEYKPDACAYGSTTIDQGFTRGRKSELAKFENASVPRTDYITKDDADNYLISIDPMGAIGWDKPTVYGRGPRSDGAYIIEVLCEQVLDAYLAYLQDVGVSYIFGGEKDIDLNVVCEKLYNLFGIKTMMVQGGAVTNNFFARAGLLDEISLVVSPVADCGGGLLTIFETMPGMDSASMPIEFDLAEAKKLDNSGLWLQYKAKKQGD